MLKLISTLFLLFSLNILYGQSSGVCDNCGDAIYYTAIIQDSIFKPSIISSNNIHEVEIIISYKKNYRLGLKDSFAYGNIGSAKFIFEDQGYIKKKCYTNQPGKITSFVQYERDSVNNIIKSFWAASDTLGNIKPLGDTLEVEYFSYKKGRLFKSKKDEIFLHKLTFSRYTYDHSGKLKEEFDSSVYSGFKHIELNEIKYTYNKNTEKIITTKDSKIDITNTIFFNKENKISLNVFYDKNGSKFEEETYLYSKDGHLIKLIDKKYPNTFYSIYPDEWVFTNYYSYSAIGLLKSIEEKFQYTDCTFKFIYK